MAGDYRFEIIKVQDIPRENRERFAEELSEYLSVSRDYLSRRVAEEDAVFFISRKKNRPIGFIVGNVSGKHLFLALIKAVSSTSFLRDNKKTVGAFLYEKFQGYAKSKQLKVILSERTQAGRKFLARMTKKPIRRR